VVFKLLSPRTYEGENDGVHYVDGLRIYHPSSESFMNFSMNE
jgi:hypothetical protein